MSLQSSGLNLSACIIEDVTGFTESLIELTECWLVNTRSPPIALNRILTQLIKYPGMVVVKPGSRRT